MAKQSQTLNRRATPAMHYIPCYGGEANVLMRHNKNIDLLINSFKLWTTQ